LLFVRTEGDRQNVYRQALVAGHPLKVLDDALEACWSPNGERIAFVRREESGGGLLAMVPAHGGPETRLYESNRPLYGARWSPRENEIVVVESPPTGSSNAYNLLFIDPDNAQPEKRPRRLPVSGPISSPAWSGGGRRLLYAQAGSTLGDFGDPVSWIVLHDLDNNLVSKLFSDEWLFPNLGQWNLSRGTALAVVGPGSVAFGRSDVKQSLREMPLAGAPARKSVLRGGRRDRQPAYSPDGEQIVFSSDRSGNLDLWLFDFRRGSLRQLTDDRAQDWDPTFTPDGRGVLWSSNRTGHLEIWSMALDGGSMRQISTDGEDAENPTQTADGAWILYWTENPAKSGIWRMRPDGTGAVRLVPGRYSVPEASPDGRWATFLSQEPARLRTVIGVLEVATGKVMPFQITVPWPPVRSERLLPGRTRWAGGGTAIAYVGVDGQGHSGIFVQDFDPHKSTDATRRILAGFSDDLAVESFGLSPDGRYAAVSSISAEISVRIARNVPNVEPAESKELR
jgi:Tol biopolymer transport system component